MASLEELKEVLKETLENRGVLGQVKAKVRAEVFNALDDHSESKPPLSNENLLINELIREYLQFNQYRYTESVLVSESGMPKVPLERDFLTNELNVVEDGPSRSVPLLYSIVAHYVGRNNSSNHKSQSRRGIQRSAFIDNPEERNCDINGVLDIENKGLVVRGGKR
ncbi:centrosomal protein 20-like [Gigantopelta aegis]|uniref:centrosomal protein 20-like n=1 Tax=Gigantopelta aegis TaxID=1735272 RepID=UPI001B88CB6D|nr:centrosomal protein 20-like [Gigantopelta aegis]